MYVSSFSVSTCSFMYLCLSKQLLKSRAMTCMEWKLRMPDAVWPDGFSFNSSLTKAGSSPRQSAGTQVQLDFFNPLTINNFAYLVCIVYSINYLI